MDIDGWIYSTAPIYPRPRSQIPVPESVPVPVPEPEEKEKEKENKQVIIPLHLLHVKTSKVSVQRT